MLSRQYANPVVFAQPLSRGAAQTAVVRIKDVQPDRFTLRVDEAPDQYGTPLTDSTPLRFGNAAQGGELHGARNRTLESAKR